MLARRFTNHAVWPKAVAIYTTNRGILRPSPNNRTAKVLLFLQLRTKQYLALFNFYDYLTVFYLLPHNFLAVYDINAPSGFTI